MKMSKFVLFISLFMLSSLALAQTYDWPPQPKAPLTDPNKDIQQILDKLRKFSSSHNSKNVKQISNFINREIVPAFAFDDMATWITGPIARQMNDADKASFLNRFKTTFIQTLNQHLGSFNPATTQIRFMPSRQMPNNNALVSLRVYRDNQLPIQLDFRMHHDQGKWKIYDVMANGFSAVMYYRQHFMGWLQRYRYPAR